MIFFGGLATLEGQQIFFLKLSGLAESMVWQRGSPRTRACVKSADTKSRVLFNIQFVKVMHPSEQHLSI